MTKFKRLYVVGACRFFTQVFLCVFVLMLTYVPQIHAKPAQDIKADQRTHNIRTAYVFNLLRFLSWHQDSPHSTSKQVNVCTSASDLGYKTLKKLESRTVNGRVINVIRLSTNKTKTTRKTQDEPYECHIAYLAPTQSGSKKVRYKKIVNSITKHHNNNVVTVGNGDEFIEQGGIVAIVLNNNRMKLKINYKKAKDIGVRMSANLLEVAHIVH